MDASNTVQPIQVIALFSSSVSYVHKARTRTRHFDNKIDSTGSITNKHQPAEIALLCRSRLEALPPVINASVLLGRLGLRVHLGTSTSSHAVIALLRDEGVNVTAFGQTDRNLNSVSAKVLSWTEFHRDAWRFISTLPDTTPLWIGSADTALALGPRLLRRRYVLQLNELYDKFWRYRVLLRPFARHAHSVVVPERSRAAIVRYWYGLPYTPHVLPNKPVFQCQTRNARIDDPRAKAIIESLGSATKLVLYQGHISAERDVRSIAAVVNKLGEPWRFAVMGADCAFLGEVRQVCPNVVVIPHIAAPGHLQVTSHAYIGAITYSRTSFNHLFCAPNKIWEYSGAAVPMICDDLPGLQMVATEGAGVCVDFQDSEALISSLLHIDAYHERYSSTAAQFFETVDMTATISAIVRGIG
jgi:hypothetical protein